MTEKMFTAVEARELVRHYQRLESEHFKKLAEELLPTVLCEIKAAAGARGRESIRYVSTPGDVFTIGSNTHEIAVIRQLCGFLEDLGFRCCFVSHERTDAGICTAFTVYWA